tara:strand:+ start:22280 stop:22540 length:261 start_codon:yes stop_codon:yes gene_type:complete
VNAKMIVILMMAVLVALFAWSRRFRKKEQATNQLEIKSFETMQLWMSNKTTENKDKAIQASAALSIAHGMNEEQAKELATKQIESL